MCRRFQSRCTGDHRKRDRRVRVLGEPVNAQSRSFLSQCLKMLLRTSIRGHVRPLVRRLVGWSVGQSVGHGSHKRSNCAKKLFHSVNTHALSRSFIFDKRGAHIGHNFAVFSYHFIFFSSPKARLHVRHQLGHSTNA